MARLFDNNAANYMSRSSVNLGLNGLTEISYAFWINITGTVAAEQTILNKTLVSYNWTPILAYISATTSKIGFEVERRATPNQAYPDWTMNAGIGTGVWTRVLFTWKRNALNATDGIAYVNGSVVGTTFTDNGYAAATGFAIEESTTDTYLIGQEVITPGKPLNAALDWVTIWKRQLTAQEVLLDYTNPRNVTNGLVSRVRLGGTDADDAYGGNMTVNGTLRDVSGNVPIRAGAQQIYDSRNLLG